MRNLLVFFMLSAVYGQSLPPSLELSNGVIRVLVYTPDAKDGMYRGTRFDWSGVIGSLKYKNHDYYGRWFTKTKPDVHDFVWDGPDIVAGACSAITGPVEEFSVVGFDEAKPGGTFLKIGVGVLRRPDAAPYDNYRLYDIVDGGKWTVERLGQSVRFAQEVPGYRYTKTLRLADGKPEMVIEHQLVNTGKKPIVSDVFDHNFLVLDHQTTGPDFEIHVPFEFQAGGQSGHVFRYSKTLQGQDTVAAQFTRFSSSPKDYNIRIENRKVGAGMQVTADRPLAKLSLWSIRSTLSMEPFVHIAIPPGGEFRWAYTYQYFTLP